MSVARLPQRVVDYFAVAKRDLKHDVFVAVRFPTVDHSDCEFPKDVSMFCFPDDAPGVEKEDGNSDSVADVVEFTFVLTEVDGKRVYVSALRDNSTGECFILTSHWAFFNQMAVFLRHAHYILTSRTSTPYPIESLLVNLIFEVPLPPRGRTEVVVPLIGTNRELVFRRPAPNGGPLDDFDVETLFHLLSVDAILSVFSATLSERRILFVSTKESSLTPVIESINNLLNPMFWRHIYIPLLPRILIEYVCTPMPFLMGVLRSYLPELALLGGICLVDLDQGTVVYVDDAGKGLLTTSPVPLLPDRPSRALSKRLRQATTDGKIDRVAIADAFQRFFAVVLGHYRKYVDFENADDAFDKRQFLEASPDGCESLSSLIDTQMFASFIDDRVRFSDDIDTLLFDDYILREQGRPAAFLSDTSQAHKTRHVCMAPVTVPGVSGPFTYWNGLQQVEPERIPSARAVDVLVDSTTESQTLASGMSHASLKFFMDQKVYSRQFHSMKIASTRHDIAFNSVIQTTIAWTGAERDALQVLSRLQWPTLAACSITALFEALHSYANLTLTARSVALTDMETNLERDLSSKLAFIDRDLKILFDEARQLDADATANKAQLESCKSALAAARKRLKSIETASPPSTARWSSTREMGKLVAARSEVQALEIERAEAEATFRTLLDLYNKRIPEIISELQRLNDERVGTFRSAISSHANSRRQQLKAEEAALADLESITKASPPPVQRVNSLVAKFIPLLDNFSEAQIASAPLSSESPTGPRSRSDAECSQGPPVPDSTQPFRYSMLMWGQFDLLFDHAVKAKAIVKQVEAALASASALFDSLPTATNRGGGLLSSLSLSPHKPLSTATSSLAGTKAEAALLDALEHQLSQLDRAAQKTMKRIKKTAVDARVLKRECKGSFAMIEKRRQKLELDVSSAQDAYSRSLSVPSVSDLNRLKPQPSNVTPKSQREIDMMSRQWQTSQVQHHCGIAYLLDQFQKVEHNRILTLRSALLDFHGALYDYYAKYRAGMDEMVPIIDAVSKGSVIYELLHRLHGHISPPVERKQPDLISSCNADQFPEVCQQISSGLDLVATIAGQLEQVIGLDDALVSRIRKQSWSLNLQDGLETVNAALKAFHQFVAEDWVNILETSAAERRKQLADLRRMRETLQSRLAMAITKEHNGRKLKTDCAAQFQRSSEEVTRIEAALKSAREKLARAEAEDSSPTTSSSIMSFMKKPVAKHRQRVAELEADLKKLQSATEQLSVEKCSSEVAYQDTLGSLYNFIQEIEMNRVEAVACCARRMNELGQELVLRAWETLHVLETSARKVDARLDMTLWVAAARKKAAYPCPDAVLRNLERSALDDDNNEKGDGVDPTDRNRALGIDSDSSSKEHRLHVTTSADPSEASDDDATPVPSRLLATPRITISSDSPGPLEPKRSLTFEEQVVTQAPLSSDEDPANVQQCLKDLCEQVAQLMTNESRTVIR